MRPSLLPFAGLLAAAGVQALTLSLAPARDNTLFESASGSLSNGSGQYLFAGRTGEGLDRRALLAFDLSTLPASAQLTRVALTLTQSKTNASSGAQTHSLHRVLASWGEGASNAGTPGGGGAAAASGDATWIHALSPNSLWANPGGDFSATASATLSTAGNGSYTWESAQLLADVQAWMDAPATNFGWILVGNETATGTAKRFNSRESTTASQRPKLTIEYTLPNSAPTTPLVGDFDGDLSVGLADFFLFADHFGQTPDAAGWDPLFDLSADLNIGFADFFLFADHFGEKAAP